MYKFSEANGVGEWYSVDGTRPLSLNFSSEYGRCLVAKCYPYNEISGEYSSILCAFEESVSLEYSDNISFCFAISCENNPTEFEVKLVLGSENKQIESVMTLRSGNMQEIALDARELNDLSYIQISIRPLYKYDKQYSLHLSSVTEGSEIYTDEQLAELNYKNEDDGAEDANLFSDAPITEASVVFLFIMISVIIIVFIVIFKRIDKKQKNTTNKTENKK